jgi:hypothetical protein
VAVNVWQHSSTGRIRVAVSCDLPGLQSLHWGVVPWGPFGDNHWELPLPEVRPAGTRVHDKTAVQTPLLPAGGGEPGAWAPGRVVIECDAADAPRDLDARAGAASENAARRAKRRKQARRRRAQAAEC